MPDLWRWRLSHPLKIPYEPLGITSQTRGSCLGDMRIVIGLKAAKAACT
jgi:hypothetical protein